AVLLITTSVIAYVHIRRRMVARHRAWMTRSYALIFSAVTFRLWVSGLSAVGLPFTLVYGSGAWLSWMINLAVAELLITRLRRGIPNRRTIRTAPPPILDGGAASGPDLQR